MLRWKLYRCTPAGASAKVPSREGCNGEVKNGRRKFPSAKPQRLYSRTREGNKTEIVEGKFIDLKWKFWRKLEQL